MVSEHMRTYDAFLVHVFMGELIGWISALQSESSGHFPQSVQSAVGVLEVSYGGLDADIDNAIEASFLETFLYGQLPESLLGARLKAGLDRMRSASPEPPAYPS